MITDPSSQNLSFLLGHGTPLSGFGNQPATVMWDQARITPLEQKLESMEEELKLKLELLEHKLENIKQV